MLYHIETGIPFKLNLPSVIYVSYSKHALNAANSDRYGFIKLESDFSTLGARIIEVEVCDRTKNPIKVLIRRSYDHKHDICMAISLVNTIKGRNVVKTVWLNTKEDTHKTLRKEVYAQQRA